MNTTPQETQPAQQANGSSLPPEFNFERPGNATDIAPFTVFASGRGGHLCRTGE
jgi:hypothetical protein